MRILNRYLIKETSLTLLGVSIVLSLIFVSGQLAGIFNLVASGKLQVTSIFMTLGLKSISNLVILLPLSFYLAILLAFSRLYKDNEVVVMTACGISQWRLVISLTGLAIVFAIFVGWLSLYLSPWAESKSELLSKEAQQKSDLESITAGKFTEFTKGEGVFYVQKFDSSELKMYDIFAQQKSQLDVFKLEGRDKAGRGKQEVRKFLDSNAVVTAESGHRFIDQKNGDKFLVLNNGFRYEGPLEDGRTWIVRFGEHGIRVNDKQQGSEIHFRQGAVPTIELWNRGSPHDIAELQWRISTVIFCFVLTLLAVPLSKTSPRQGRYAKLALALLVFVIYLNLLNISRAWLNKEEISPYIGMWWVHILATIVALMMYVQWKPLLARFRNGKNKVS